MSNHTPSQQQRNGEHVLYCFNNDAITYGSRVNANDLKFDIVLEADKVVRLINPSSDPRLSWQRIRNHCHIDWGDGHITKWYARVINSGRFNRDSEFIPQHEYKNANVGDRFTITVKCREPLVPIYCRLDKIWGEFPEDIYRVKSNREADDDVGLFGECNHVDYPELSLLNKHRDTVHTLGPDLLVKWRNTDMTNMFSHFIALREVPLGFFRTLMGNVLSYQNCFKACDSLERVDAGLLGLGNNTVRVLDSMFEGCISLKNTIYLQNSESLISVKSMYKDCHKLNICDERLLNYCPNIVHADRIFMNDKMLGTLGPKVLKFSLNMETISEACRNTGMTQTYISIGKMSKLHNAVRMYYECDKLATITNAFFQNTGINATEEVDFDEIFMNSGDKTNGCTVPSKLCQPIGNITKLKANNSKWFHNFNWRGNDFPADLFRDTFKNGSNRKIYTIEDLISFASFPEVTSIELQNRIFTGNQENLVQSVNLFAGVGEVANKTKEKIDTVDRKPITYFNRDMFVDMINLESVYGAFSSTKLEFKFYEDIFRENKKLNDFRNLFNKCIYKFNKFPIDYIVRTTSVDSDIDMSNMYDSSNIRVYRPIHWSSTKNVRYKMNDIVRNNTEGVSVPVEFMLDGRNQVDSDYAHEYHPRGIEYIYQSNNLNNHTVTIKLESGVDSTGASMEKHLTPANIDWGDGTRETWNPTSVTDELSHKYSGGGCTKIVIKSDRTPYFIKQNPLGTEDETYPLLEVRGEFPYASFDTYDSTDGMTCFMSYYHLDQSVFRIIHANGDMFSGALVYGSVRSYHPYLMKYNSNDTNPGRIFNPYILSTPIWDVQALEPAIADCVIYPRFFENCVNAKSLSHTLNLDTKMIPDDIFPKVLSHNSPVDMKFMGGQHQDNKDSKFKYHLKTSLYRDWMINNIKNLNQSELYLSYPILPYNSGWISKLPYSSPLYEKLTFVVRDITINNIGLERLSAGNIGEVRIEIFTDNGIIDKKVNITNDADLAGCVGNLTGELNVINIYSKVPLWLDNHNIINEVRGVIPECNLSKTFKTLAPNVTRISETLFYRLTNKSFNEMFKDCTKLEQLPPHLFLCNTKAESFVSCFENCTSLDRVPDYFLVCYNHDIDCSNMFKGCTGIKHVYRPISDSVLGRVKVNDMFLECQTTAFELDKNMSDQALIGVWYTGDAKLEKADLTSHWQRATADIPTVFTPYHYDNNHNGNVSEITDIDLEKVSASIYVADPINTFGAETVIPKPRELGKAFGYRFTHVHFEKTSCIKMNDLCELTRYAIHMHSFQAGGSVGAVRPIPRRMFSDDKLIPNKNFMFWNENLSDLYAIFEGSVLYTPFHSSFLKMNDRLVGINRMFYGAHIRHVDDIDVGGVLGKNTLKDLYLGARARSHELNLDVLFDRNIELMSVFDDSFNGIKGNFNGDKLHLGTCNPYTVVRMFANASSDEVIINEENGYPFTMYAFENVLNNSNLSRHGSYEFTLTANGMLKYNQKVVNDNGLIKKLCAFKQVKTEDKECPVKGLYKQCINLVNVPEDCFTSLDPAIPIELNSIFMGTKISKLPKINHLIQLANTKDLFNSCAKLSDPIIPANYIKSDYQSSEVLLESMFAFSNARVENQFIDIMSTATFNVIASLEDCISTIGDDPEIFLGIKYNLAPENNSRVNATGKVKDAFHQVIQTKKPSISLHMEYIGDHTTSIKTVNDMEISWGDGSLNEKYKGNIDFATLRHTYDKAGEYEVQIRCHEFTVYVETSPLDYEDVITKSVGKFTTGKATEVTSKILSDMFGTNVESFEDGLFDNLSNPEEVEKLERTFESQSKMLNIPNSILKPFVNLKSLIGTFNGCNMVNSIPEDIFKFNINLELLSNVFTNCSLVTIPAKIFESNTKLITLDRVFQSNVITTAGIPNNIFKTLVALENIINPFGGNSNIEITNDERWNNIFKYNTNLTRISGIASGASLKSIPVNILNGLNKLTQVDSLFEYDGNNSLQDSNINLSVDLFNGTSNKIVNCSKIFKNRKNIKSVNAAIFRNLTGINNLSEAFYGTGITDIPKYIVDVVHTSQNIDCGGMFAECRDVVASENEPINQDANRIVNTTDMLKNVNYKICEPEIFNGVHTNGNSPYNSGYVWNTSPIRYSIVWYEQSEKPISISLHEMFKWQKENFEPIYLESILFTLGNINDKLSINKTFQSISELNNYVLDLSKYHDSIVDNTNFVIWIWSNKPLMIKFDKSYSYWCGLFSGIPYSKNFAQEKYAISKIAVNEVGLAWPHEIYYYMDNNKDNVTSLNWLDLKYGQSSDYGRFDLLRTSSINNFKNCTNVDDLLYKCGHNLALTIDGNPSYNTDCTPLFTNMPHLKSVSSVFNETTFSDYGTDVGTQSYLDHPGMKNWEPFNGLHEIENFTYLYRGSNIPKTFKIDFGTPNGVKSIGGMFERCKFDIEIPYNYFDSMRKISHIDVEWDPPTDKHYYFAMNHMFNGSAVTNIRDKSNNKILMSEWNPDIDVSTDINMAGMFTSSLIPTDQRLEFLDSLCIIKNKTYNRLKMNGFSPFKPTETSIDVTPYLKNGKLLNITSNIKEIDMKNLYSNSKLINIPAKSIVLPDSLTSIDVRDMFQGCTADKSVENISDVFVYNGSATIDYESTGLQIVDKYLIRGTMLFAGYNGNKEYHKASYSTDSDRGQTTPDHGTRTLKYGSKKPLDFYISNFLIYPEEIIIEIRGLQLESFSLTLDKFNIDFKRINPNAKLHDFDVVYTYEIVDKSLISEIYNCIQANVSYKYNI